MFIISDFSKTFTRTDMPTTWSVFAKSGLLGDEYTSDRDALYEENISYEQAGDITKTEQWFLDHAKLFVKYGLTEELIDQVVMDDAYFAPRDGVREFLDMIREKDIPLIIVTSGVSNFVERWFKLRYNYTPNALFGTELIIEDGKVVGVLEDSIICPLDKRVEIDAGDPEANSGGQKEEIIILGDNREDLTVVEKYTRSFGFTDEDRGFDINLGKTGSMNNVVL